jgi:hypothetical protein
VFIRKVVSFYTLRFIHQPLYISLKMSILMKVSILIIISMIFFGCNKEQKINIFEEARKGNHLDMAQELSVSDFFQIWVRRGIPWKANVEISEVYNEKNNIYFVEVLGLKNQRYLGNRKFEKGVEKLFKVNKSELNKSFGFYNDLYPTGIIGVDMIEEYATKVGVKNEYSQNHLNDVIFKYELKEQGILMTCKNNGNEYNSFYNATEKKFE